MVCHPMGCYSTFFLGPEGLVKDLLVPGSIGGFLLQSVWGGQGPWQVQSRLIRDYCKILCPGRSGIDALSISF